MSDVDTMKAFEEFVSREESDVNDCDVQYCLNPAVGTYELGDVVLQLCDAHGKQVA